MELRKGNGGRLTDTPGGTGDEHDLAGGAVLEARFRIDGFIHGMVRAEIGKLVLN